MTINWRTQAACRGLDTNLFFPERGDLTAAIEAKNVCAGCTVTADCWHEVMTMPSDHAQHGIWAGTSPKERRGHRGPYRQTEAA